MVSDLVINDYHGDFDYDSDTITYVGGLGISGQALTRTGKVSSIAFSVSVNAATDYEWETDESPTGWNHRSDSATYTSYKYATASDPIVKSVSFDDGDFSVDNHDYTLQEVQSIIDPVVLKHLLNPETYAKLLSSKFGDVADSLDAEVGDDSDNY